MGTETVRETSLSSRGSLSDLVVGFFEEIEGNANPESDGEGEGEGSIGNDAERKAFWETQRQLLHEALSKTSSAEKRIRAATEDIVRTMRSEDLICSCSNRTVRDCRSCSLRHVADRLRCAGFNSALCQSKWRRSPDILSGEHSYVDVVAESKKGPAAVRVVIELNFRAEFEMARASGEYSGLVASLPEVFVGKAERLKSAVKVMCAAAKKCMKDNKMHMAPWRKLKYMQAKWLTAPQRAAPGFAPAATTEPAGTAERRRKMRASLLTFDLHPTAVEVV
ncbi:uncharacterized protein LOC109722018 [Ananas comosus]|uniref:Uncharacterized protein LOC109722018 n=1 Tax=Ananas comosus TaxID=4615 RepID=A0A6P5G9Z3_ANACO|nr:uncharacterized protein LOC109722018 [Ananas comosus]